MKFSRRTLLKSAGMTAGAAALLPFAQRFAPLAHAAEQKRLIVFWTPNGLVPGKQSELLAELGEHQSDLTILRNVTYSGTGDHKTGMPFSTTGYTAEKKGVSIDQEIATAIGGGAPSLVLCGQSKNENYRGYISQDTSGAWVPPIRDPKTAFETVFGPITGGTTPTPSPTGPATYSAELEKHILDTAIADAETLRNKLPSSEVIKMDAQLTALANLKKSIDSGGGGTGGSGGGGFSDCNSVDENLFNVSGPGYADRVKLHMDLITASFACDARRVATLMMAPAGHDAMSYSATDVGESIGGDIHNNIAHHVNEAGDSAAKMLKIAKFEARQLKYLITRLKEVDAFKNTTILWTTECTDGDHGHTDIPVYVIGSAGGALKTGVTIDVGGYNYLRVLISLAQAVGHTGLSKFGDPTHGADGPLAALMA